MHFENICSLDCWGVVLAKFVVFYCNCIMENFKELEAEMQKVKNFKKLDRAEMQKVLGGNFPCTCTGADGQTRSQDVSTVQECWALC